MQVSKWCYLVAVVLLGVVRGSDHDSSTQSQVRNCERLQGRINVKSSR